MSEENKYILEVKEVHTSFFTDAGEVKAVNGISFKLETVNPLPHIPSCRFWRRPVRSLAER